jgi:hypothetical protein
MRGFGHTVAQLTSQPNPHSPGVSYEKKFLPEGTNMKPPKNHYISLGAFISNVP